jgi:RNA polymerase-binding transcription factor DksA
MLRRAREESMQVLGGTNEALARRARRRKRSGDQLEEIENEIDLIVAQQESECLAAIDRALGVLRRTPAKYGVCATCSGSIEPAFLDVAPWALTCAAHDMVAPVV